MPPRVTLQGRILSLLISLGCLTVLIIAANLLPSPTGMGTHTQMGLQQCQFAIKTGLPCPSCGMTTSFSWFARGNFAASFYIQPMGFVIAIVTVIAFWTGLYVAISGKAAHRLVLWVPTGYYLYPLLALAVAAWAWKIFIHKHGIDGWH